MEKLNFDIVKYQILEEDKKVNLLTEIFLKYLDKDQFIDNPSEELLEDIYYETTFKIQKLFVSEQGEIDYKVETYENGTFLYYSETRNMTINEVEYQTFKNLPNFFRFQFNFRKDDYKGNKGKIDTKRIGYKVFLNFKNLIKEKPQSKTQKRFPAPVIIAMLKELGVFAKFTQKGYNRQSVIDTLYQIIGSDKTNIGKYYDSMVKDNNMDFTDKHQKDAKDFLNSKGY